MWIYPGNATITKHEAQPSFPRFQKTERWGKTMTKQMLPIKSLMHKHRTATEEQPWTYQLKNYCGLKPFLWKTASPLILMKPQITNIMFGSHRGLVPHQWNITVSRPRWLSWMRRPTGDQEVAGSTPSRSATFFRGDWSWNIFYGHSLPSADSRRAVVSFWRKNVHNTG